MLGGGGSGSDPWDEKSLFLSWSISIHYSTPVLIPIYFKMQHDRIEHIENEGIPVALKEDFSIDFSALLD